MRLRQSQNDTVQPIEALRQSLRDAGLLYVVTSAEGQLLSQDDAATDWLRTLFCSAKPFQFALRQCVEQWSQQAAPSPAEATTGLWVLPVAIKSRRIAIGYAIAVAPTSEFIASEQLAAMCESSRVDYQLTRKLLADLPVTPRSEIGRLHSLFIGLHETHTRLLDENRAVESVGQQLAESYEEINLLYTIIQSMTVVEQPERFVSIVCEELLETLPYCWVVAHLARDPEHLKRLAGRTVIAGDTGRPIAFVKNLADQLLAIAQPDAPMVLSPSSPPPAGIDIAIDMTLLVLPISRDGIVLGIMIAGDKQGEDRAASSADMKLLGATSSHMAIFLENAALYDDLNAMFVGTLEALTASIDAKDRYTCGHSQRVAHLTELLAHSIGIDAATTARMRIAGLVHDVGKIGVPERVLLKPGKLTDEEFEWIRQHPEIGYRILRDIPQMEDILPGVLYHHERWDGRGYPSGRAGEDIPLVARLIGLADSFDAMSSTRTYRSAMSRSQVLAEIERSAGSQFDPALVPVFISLNFAEYDALAKIHREQEQRPLAEDAA